MYIYSTHIPARLFIKETLACAAYINSKLEVKCLTTYFCQNTSMLLQGIALVHAHTSALHLVHTLYRVKSVNNVSL